jgi:hypothetical protein
MTPVLTPAGIVRVPAATVPLAVAYWTVTGAAARAVRVTVKRAVGLVPEPSTTLTVPLSGSGGRRCRRYR